MSVNIPKREESSYAYQYSNDYADPQRIIEIYTDSATLALSSKNPETATNRYWLAVEAYHQLMSMPLSQNIKSTLQQKTEQMVEQFPEKVVVNEINGLMEKAPKYKTAKKKKELLLKAKTSAINGLNSLQESDRLKTLLEDLNNEILLLEDV